MLSIHAPAEPILDFLGETPLTELHMHMGFSVSSLMLWELAHQQGLRLPTKNFREFQQLVNAAETHDYEAYLMKYDLPERIQSSPAAVFKSVEYIFSSGFEKNNTRTLELRFNPLFRNRNGEIDLDYVVIYALQAMERVMLKYPIRGGLILEFDRRLDHAQNAVILEKAIKYRDRGVVGVDLAGPVDRFKQSQEFHPKDLADLYEEAKKAGLGTTFHTGEATGLDEMADVLEYIKPDRIGHGLAAVQDTDMLQEIAAQGIVMENCPTSNLLTHVVEDYVEMKQIFETFEEYGVLYTINTDGAESLQTSLRDEYKRLLENDVLSEQQVLQCNKVAEASTFINYPALTSADKADAFQFASEFAKHYAVH